MKSIIINSSLVPENKTLEDVLNDIAVMLDKQNKFEDIVYDILNNSDLDKADITSLFMLSQTNKIKFYLNLIQDNI